VNEINNTTFRAVSLRLANISLNDPLTRSQANEALPERRTPTRYRKPQGREYFQSHFICATVSTRAPIECARGDNTRSYRRRLRLRDVLEVEDVPRLQRVSSDGNIVPIAVVLPNYCFSLVEHDPS